MRLFHFKKRILSVIVFYELFMQSFSLYTRDSFPFPPPCYNGFHKKGVVSLCKTKKSCGTPAPRPLFLRMLSQRFAQSCTMPLNSTNGVLFCEARQHLHLWSSPFALRFFQAAPGIRRGTVPVLHTVYGKNSTLQRPLGQFLPCVLPRQKTFKSFVQFRHRISF